MWHACSSGFVQPNDAVRVFVAHQFSRCTFSSLAVQRNVTNKTPSGFCNFQFKSLWVSNTTFWIQTQCERLMGQRSPSLCPSCNRIHAVRTPVFKAPWCSYEKNEIPNNRKSSQQNRLIKKKSSEDFLKTCRKKTTNSCWKGVGSVANVFVLDHFICEEWTLLERLVSARLAEKPHGMIAISVYIRVYSKYDDPCCETIHRVHPTVYAVFQPDVTTEDPALLFGLPLNFKMF